MTVASRWRTLLALTVAAVLLGIAGCTATNSDGGETTPSATSPVTSAPPSSSAPATTADTRATPEVIVATWRAFRADVVAVSRTADWSSPRLATHATGRVLERLRGQFRGLAERGWVTRGTIRLLHPRAVDLKATTAKLQDCVDTARFV